jgi:hypothetical protein
MAEAIRTIMAQDDLPNNLNKPKWKFTKVIIKIYKERKWFNSNPRAKS